MARREGRRASYHQAASGRDLVQGGVMIMTIKEVLFLVDRWDVYRLYPFLVNTGGSDGIF